VSGESETYEPLPWERPTAASLAQPHIVLAWSLDEPDRVGECIAVDGPRALGRGAALADDPAPRATPQRMRPGHNQPMPPIGNARIGRIQLLLAPVGSERISVTSLGRALVRINGAPLEQAAIARAGDVIEIHNAATYLVTLRPKRLPALRNGAFPDFEFGGADPFGMIGESEAAWRLRDALQLASTTDRHVLLLGDSGTGKELAARAIHGLSGRRDRSLVCRNAATLPEGIVDAELFGNMRGYPSSGMPERPGLFGEADGGTLFLDEIGELSERMQAHLLRVLDAGGEYQRLGESKPRRSSFRLIAATNRASDALKHDLLARFTHRVELPTLSERRDDLALPVAAQLRRIASAHPALANRFFERRTGQVAEPRLAPHVIARLLRHELQHNVRELERLLWLAIGSAPADYIGLTPALEAELDDAEQAVAQPAPEIDRLTLLRALSEHDRSPTRMAQALGLKNRYVLIRLLKKHGLSASEPNPGGDA